MLHNGFQDFLHLISLRLGEALGETPVNVVCDDQRDLFRGFGWGRGSACFLTPLLHYLLKLVCVRYEGRIVRPEGVNFKRGNWLFPTAHSLLVFHLFVPELLFPLVQRAKRRVH